MPKASKSNTAKDAPIGSGMAKRTKDTIVNRRKTNCEKSGGTWDSKNLRCKL